MSGIVRFGDALVSPVIASKFRTLAWGLPFRVQSARRRHNSCHWLYMGFDEVDLLRVQTVLGIELLVDLRDGL